MLRRKIALGEREQKGPRGFAREMEETALGRRWRRRHPPPAARRRYGRRRPCVLPAAAASLTLKTLRQGRCYCPPREVSSSSRLLEGLAAAAAAAAAARRKEKEMGKKLNSNNIREP